MYKLKNRIIFRQFSIILWLFFKLICVSIFNVIREPRPENLKDQRVRLCVTPVDDRREKYTKFGDDSKAEWCKDCDDYKIMQCGRSMIEMLGVLAIIAVLSVGGIAGYSKAMFMWKSNIQKNALTELMMTMIKIKPNLSRNMTGDYINNVIYQMGEMPEGLTLENTAFIDKNNTQFNVYWGIKEDDGMKLRYRLYGFMPSQKGYKFIIQETKEYCRNLHLAAKSVAREINYIYFWRNGSQSSYSKSSMSGDELLSATTTDIYKRCDIVLDDDALGISSIVVDFKVD